MPKQLFQILENGKSQANIHLDRKNIGLFLSWKIHTQTWVATGLELSQTTKVYVNPKLLLPQLVHHNI